MGQRTGEGQGAVEARKEGLAWGAWLKVGPSSVVSGWGGDSGGGEGQAALEARKEGHFWGVRHKVGSFK